MGKVKKIRPVEAVELRVKDLRKILYKLNKEARKRSYQFKKAGYADTEIGGLSGDLKNVKKLRKTDLINEVVNLSLTLSRKGSYITNYRMHNKIHADILQKKGFDFINTKNIADFERWMELVKYAHGKAMPDSDTAVKIYEYISKHNISIDTIKDNFFKFLGSEKGLLDLKDALSGDEDLNKSSQKIRDKMKRKGII